MGQLSAPSPPRGLVIREAEEQDLDRVAVLLQAADDARVMSVDGLRHRRKPRPERGRTIDIVAELDGLVVGTGGAGLNTDTTTAGAGRAFLAVDVEQRRHGIGDALGATLVDHLRSLGATKATSLIRWAEEGERWALARGWSRLLTGPLIAVDPRGIPEPSTRPGFRCVAMRDVAPEDAYTAITAAAIDEPSPVPNDDIRLEDFLQEWNDPDFDLGASTAVVD